VEPIENKALDIINNAKENDAILSVQIHELSEAAEVRRNGASELIRVETPEAVAMKE